MSGLSDDMRLEQEEAESGIGYVVVKTDGHCRLVIGNRTLGVAVQALAKRLPNAFPPGTSDSRADALPAWRPPPRARRCGGAGGQAQTASVARIPRAPRLAQFIA